MDNHSAAGQADECADNVLVIGDGPHPQQEDGDGAIPPSLPLSPPNWITIPIVGQIVFDWWTTTLHFMCLNIPGRWRFPICWPGTIVWNLPKGFSKRYFQRHYLYRGSPGDSRRWYVVNLQHEIVFDTVNNMYCIQLVGEQGTVRFPIIWPNSVLDEGDDYDVATGFQSDCEDSDEGDDESEGSCSVSAVSSGSGAAGAELAV